MAFEDFLDRPIDEAQTPNEIIYIIIDDTLVSCLHNSGLSGQ